MDSETGTGGVVVTRIIRDCRHCRHYRLDAGVGRPGAPCSACATLCRDRQGGLWVSSRPFNGSDTMAVRPDQLCEPPRSLRP